MNAKMNPVCPICGFKAERGSGTDFGLVHGNTRRFRAKSFALWKCPGCQSIVSLEPVDYADIYADYRLNTRSLDAFARGTLGNLLKRLVREGLTNADSIFDYGCGNGLFVDFLKSKGYPNVVGYDPFMPNYADRPTELFDCVVANDVIEHVDDPRAVIADAARFVNPAASFIWEPRTPPGWR